jgi:hypothetical protein
MTMNAAEIKRSLETEAPAILKESPDFREWLEDFVRRQMAVRASHKS